MFKKKKTLSGCNGSNRENKKTQTNKTHRLTRQACGGWRQEAVLSSLILRSSSNTKVLKKSGLMLFLLPSCGLSARRSIDPSSCFLSPPLLGSGHGEEGGGGGFNPRCLWANCGVTPGTSRQLVAGPQREKTPRSYWSACCDWGNVDNCTTQRQKGGRQTLKFLTATPQSSSKRNKSPARKNKEKEKNRDCRWMTMRNLEKSRPGLVCQQTP